MYVCNLLGSDICISPCFHSGSSPHCRFSYKQFYCLSRTNILLRAKNTLLSPKTSTFSQNIRPSRCTSVEHEFFFSLEKESSLLNTSFQRPYNVSRLQANNLHYLAYHHLNHLCSIHRFKSWLHSGSHYLTNYSDIYRSSLWLLRNTGVLTYNRTEHLKQRTTFTYISSNIFHLHHDFRSTVPWPRRGFVMTRCFPSYLHSAFCFPYPPLEF